MPAPGGAAGVCFFGFSATSASVVMSSEATEAASSIAVRLGRVDHAGANQVLVLSGRGVEAPIVLGVLEQLADHKRAILAGILRDLPRRHLDGATHDLDASALVAIVRLDAVERLQGAQQRHAAAGQDALLNRGAGRMHGRRRRGPCVPSPRPRSHRRRGRELGQPLLQLLAVIIGGRLLDLRLDLRDARLDVLLLAGAVDDGGVLLLDHHLLGARVELEDPYVLIHEKKLSGLQTMLPLLEAILKLDAEVFGDRGAAGEDGDVLEHGLAAIAEAGRLHRRDLEAATQLVDHQCGKRLALDVLGNDQQRLAGLHHRIFSGLVTK
jgi:hypothetical protein